MDIRTTVRTTAQNVIDEVQFRFDVFPTLYYQPLPWIGLTSAKRGEGTVARWTAIEASLADHSISSALDIGCAVGYFSISLALKGVPVLGVEMDSRVLRIAMHTSKRLAIDNIGFSLMAVNLETTRLLPNVDLVLLLSVWHHWVRQYGLDDAGRLLSMVWEKTSKVLVFETGEAEMPEEFGLPDMTPTPRDWLEHYLTSVCDASTAVHLGQFKAFGPGGDENCNIVERNLFMLVRSAEAISKPANNTTAAAKETNVSTAGATTGSLPLHLP
ncbi:MAG: class SAM-dependent methyltransferase [Chloroflexi bacterium]|nr:class SAM-dependent methyltransferase [Chloroflexota bacterium]